MRSRVLLRGPIVLAAAVSVTPPSMAIDLTVTVSGLSWTASPTAVTYDVILGDLNALSASAGNFTSSTQLCLANDLGSQNLSTAAVPAPGLGYWYLVRGVRLGGTDNDTYDEGGGQVGSRDAEVAASSAGCSNVDAEEQARAGSVSSLGTSYSSFIAAVQAAGHSPQDNTIEAGEGAGSSSFQTPGWLTLQQGRDKADDTVTLSNPSGTSASVLFTVTQQQLDPNGPVPSLLFTPPVTPVGSPVYRDALRTLERRYMATLGGGQAITVQGAEIRSLGLMSISSLDVSGAITLNVGYLVSHLAPAFFLGGKCDPIPKPCYYCGPHYGCLSTEPKCLATKYSVCFGYWVEEDECGCFP